MTARDTGLLCQPPLADYVCTDIKTFVESLYAHYPWYKKASQTTEDEKLSKKKATHLSATIVVKLAVLQMPVMLQVSGVIQLTFMCSIVMISNIKTDTVCIQVATVFTLVQVLDGDTYYRVVH